jgi:hypothetical protein
MEKFFTDRSNGVLCDGFLSTALQVNIKASIPNWESNKNYSDQVILCTEGQKINKGQ